MQQAPNAFAALIQRYMWKDREPPINPNRLAVELGISRQTVMNWLNGSKPAADLLPAVAEKLGISLAEVYRVAGYAVPAELQMREDWFAYLRERIEHDDSLALKDRKRLLDHVRELQEHYADGDADAPKVRLAR